MPNPSRETQNLRRKRGQGHIYFPCSADHEQDWQPDPVDPSLAICDDHTYIPYINRHAGTPSKTETKDTMRLGTAQFCYVGLGPERCQHCYYN